ncbi:MAG: transglycosylase domain-containing protein [Erysipelotrichaceae bacterium]|nr:transglycosylase domain-containing protein [Erysipelotrichaceae bacterium]
MNNDMKDEKTAPKKRTKKIQDVASEKTENSTTKKRQTAKKEPSEISEVAPKKKTTRKKKTVETPVVTEEVLIPEVKEEIETVEDIAEEIKEEKPKRPKTKLGIKILATLVCLIVIAGLCVGGYAIYFASQLLEGKPEFNAQKLEAADSTTIYDANGNEIVELGLYLRENIEYDEMPNCLIDAFLSIEDSRYFEHFGFDIPRFTMAAIQNLKSGGFGQGGSTITMQLVKNSYFQVDADGESTMAASSGMAGVQRKMQEIVLAIEANQALSKEKIIANYINKINFGNNIRGVQKAAQYYFGKDAKEINLVESAFLAGIINAPNIYNPYNELYKHDENYIYLNSNITYLENAQIRTAEVLDLMAYHGYITETEAELAKTINIEDLLAGVHKKFKSYSEFYQDYIDAVINEAIEVTGKDPYTTSMQIYTSMDPYMQEVLYNIENEKTHLKYTNKLEQSALVVLNNQTGELVALGAGRNQAQSARQFNRATSAYLQPGSTIKPILEYALAFDRLGWSTAHTITDKPYYLYGGNILLANAGNQGYTGDMLMNEAIARSLNTPAVQTLAAVCEEIGEEGVRQYLRDIGFTRNVDTFDLQWAIGGNTCVCTPVQLAAAHAMLMNEGYYVTPHTIKYIKFADGTVYEADTVGTQVISSAAAYMTAICEEYNVSGPFVNNMQVLKSSYPVYAKTGTTDWATAGRAYGIPTGAPKDMWLMCQTSNYTVTVWLGFDKAERGAYFTTAEDMGNLKGRIGKYILDQLYDHFEYDASGVEQPDDCVEVKIVKGAYPYAKPDGAHETVTGYIRKEALEAKPLTTVEDVLSNLPVRENSADIHITGFIDEYGTAKITISDGGYYCSDGVQDTSAVNYQGKYTEGTGRCFFPHYVETRRGSAYANVYIKVDGNTVSSAEGEGYVEMYGIPEGRKYQACSWTSNREMCTEISRQYYSE